MIMMFGEASTLWETKSPEWLQEMQAFMMKKDQELRDAGEHVDGRALADVEQAKTIRIQDGAPVPTDGPFAETKEQLGGFYIIDVPNLDDAIAWAAKIPNVHRASVEIRPIMVFE